MRNFFYNTFVRKTTLAGYGAFFDSVSSGSQILDIGVGNGLMFEVYHQKIKDLQLSLYGIDLNQSYLKHCQKIIKKFHLEPYVQIAEQDFLTAEFNTPFDSIFFSMSFPLIQDQEKALAKAKSLLKAGGTLAFFQTMQNKRSRTMELLKPKLKYISTIDFGKVNYEDAFLDLLDHHHLLISERKRLHQITPTSEVQVLFVKLKEEQKKENQKKEV
jgi:ubiquinone/menaquinone biosynthesis C-methylase UbiE